MPAKKSTKKTTKRKTAKRKSRKKAASKKKLALQKDDPIAKSWEGKVPPDDSEGVISETPLGTEEKPEKEFPKIKTYTIIEDPLKRTDKKAAFQVVEIVIQSGKVINVLPLSEMTTSKQEVANSFRNAIFEKVIRPMAVG